MALDVNALISLLTYAVVAICVLLVAKLAVGAVGVPVNAGLNKVAKPTILGITGLFNICAGATVAFQSAETCAAGIVGLLVKSV